MHSTMYHHTMNPTPFCGEVSLHHTRSACRMWYISYAETSSRWNKTSLTARVARKPPFPTSTLTEPPYPCTSWRTTTTTTKTERGVGGACRRGACERARQLQRRVQREDCHSAAGRGRHRKQQQCRCCGRCCCCCCSSRCDKNKRARFQTSGTVVVATVVVGIQGPGKRTIDD